MCEWHINVDNVILNLISREVLHVTFRLCTKNSCFYCDKCCHQADGSRELYGHIENKHDEVANYCDSRENLQVP